ncbi:DNA/RNA non-specific endonuclease [Larkinella soli]|uniref:DNA/RNA non-specific endonuclease n=1 Tax=Larkinella soli TaxID=1770527 RepID=UPI000FFB97FB|nr:DNA/RNA non-specific endonuclease [Larkinella soli]
MFFRSSYRSRRFSRRGFRLRGNTLILLFVFFLIGLFLHYGGRTQPVVAFWDDLKGLLGIKSRTEVRKDNPYKAPEPQGRSGSEDVATDERPEGEATATRHDARLKLFDFEKQADFILPARSAGDQVIRHEGYTLRYRDDFEQADWVAYPLLENELEGDADRKNEQFQPDPLVETGTARSSDYSRSGYDRGHLAPAGDFKFSQRMMRETFFMSNISPQVPDFNRGIWKELEETVRTWAVRDKGLYVVTGPVLQPGLKRIGKGTKVAVPLYYYKVILYCNNPTIRIIAFLMKNEGSERSLKQFVVPVDQVEQQTGIDFFPLIPDALEQRLESARPSQTIPEWFSL